MKKKVLYEKISQKKNNDPSEIRPKISKKNYFIYH